MSCLRCYQTIRACAVSCLFNGPVTQVVTEDKPLKTDALPRLAFAAGELVCHRVVVKRPGEVSDIEMLNLRFRYWARMRLCLRPCLSLNFCRSPLRQRILPEYAWLSVHSGYRGKWRVVAVGTQSGVRVGESVIVFWVRHGWTRKWIPVPRLCSEEAEGLSFEEACALPAWVSPWFMHFRNAVAKARRSDQTAAGAPDWWPFSLAQHYGGEIYATVWFKQKLELFATTGCPSYHQNYRQQICSG